MSCLAQEEFRALTCPWTRLLLMFVCELLCAILPVIVTRLFRKPFATS